MSDEPPGQSGPVVRVLYVSGGSSTEDEIDADEWGDVSLRMARDVEAALDELDAGTYDCVVVEPGDDHRSLTTLTGHDSAVPVVLYTRWESDEIDTILLEEVETVVERWDASASRRLLHRKIHALVGATSDAPGEDFDDYEQLVSTARDGIYVLDENGRFRFVNESLATKLGYAREDLVGAHIASVQAPGELEKSQRILDETMADEDTESELHDVVMVRRDGKRIVFSAHFAVQYDECGNYAGVVGVLRDVTEQRRQERELRRQRERLDEFASLVAHDIRNPISILQGYLRTYLDAADEGDEVDDALLEDAFAEAERMERLVDDFLELARAGKVDRSNGPVDVGEAIESAFRRLDAETATLRLLDPPRAVNADRDRLVQLFENLLWNAVEHAGPDVTLRVGSLDRNGFYVADDGPGIPASDRQRVFEHGVTTDDDGTGLGLTIVSTIAEAHGWDVSITEGEDGGARFEVTWTDTSGNGVPPASDLTEPTG